MYTNEEVDEKNKSCIEKIYYINESMYETETYEQIKELYHKKIEIIFDFLDLEEINISKYLEAEKSFEKFLNEAETNNFEYKCNFSDEIYIIIRKDTKIDKVKSFFDNCIDEISKQNIKSEASLFSNFFEYDFKKLSSGEKENLSVFSSLNENISSFFTCKKNYILLFDEIERCMHPEMCRCIINVLVDFLNQYTDKNFQIIISSHSPFVSADILNENIICLSRDANYTKAIKNNEQTFAQNIHTLLKNQFFLSSTLGEYATKTVMMIIKCINENDSNKYYEIINNFLDNKDSSYQEQICKNDCVSYIEKIISKIGEPIIRENLKMQWNQRQKTIQKQIDYHKAEIQRLQSQENIKND